MTKQEKLREAYLKYKRDVYGEEMMIHAIANYLLADDEPAGVDRSLRGPVEVTYADEVDLRYAREEGLGLDKHRSTVSDLTWEQVEERYLMVRKLTPADLEATE